jgi:hypothetical protein
MHESTVPVLQAIQAILAPALGISAVGLLLLGLTNRYSSIVNRIRLINDERRKIHRTLGEKEPLSYVDQTRYMSIQKQIQELLVRSRYVRNAILAYQAAIAFFVLTSTFIGLNLFFVSEIMQVLPLGLFVAGMLTLFVGVVFAALEVLRSHTIVLLEVKAEE